MVTRGRQQMAIWRMRITCWIPKATNTDSEYVILTAFQLQQWLRERATTLRFTCIACLSLTKDIHKRQYYYLQFCFRSTFRVLSCTYI